MSNNDKATPDKQEFLELVNGLLDENADVDKSAALINQHLARLEPAVPLDAREERARDVVNHWREMYREISVFLRKHPMAMSDLCDRIAAALTTTSATSGATPSVSAAIAEVANVSYIPTGEPTPWAEGFEAAKKAIIKRLRALPPDARAVDGDAMERAAQIADSEKKAQLAAFKAGDETAFARSVIADDIASAIRAAAITATKKETK